MPYLSPPTLTRVEHVNAGRKPRHPMPPPAALLDRRLHSPRTQSANPVSRASRIIVTLDGFAGQCRVPKLRPSGWVGSMGSRPFPDNPYPLWSPVVISLSCPGNKYRYESAPVVAFTRLGRKSPNPGNRVMAACRWLASLHVP